MCVCVREEREYCVCESIVFARAQVPGVPRRLAFVCWPVWGIHMENIPGRYFLK